MPILSVIQLGLMLVLVGILLFLAAKLRASNRNARAARLAEYRLEQRILEIGEEERRNIGINLHDGLGQHLTAIALLSESLMLRLRADKHPTQERVESFIEQAERITAMVSQSVEWTRDLARGLSPLTLESEGLLAALEELTLIARKLLNVTCTLQSIGSSPPQLDPATSLHLYRIVQEAISNAVRHGKAKTVRIAMKYMERDGLTLTISDDGVGISPRMLAAPGIGLRIMHYRAKMIGGAVSIDRNPASEGNRGTMVTCHLPAGACARSGAHANAGTAATGTATADTTATTDISQPPIAPTSAPGRIVTP